MKIAVAGTGYIGLSIATLLLQHNEVTAVDILLEKVSGLKEGSEKVPLGRNYSKQQDFFSVFD